MPKESIKICLKNINSNRINKPFQQWVVGKLGKLDIDL